MNVAQLALLAAGGYMLWTYYTRGASTGNGSSSGGGSSAGNSGSNGSSSGGGSSTGNTGNSNGSSSGGGNSNGGNSGATHSNNYPLDVAIRKAANGDQLAIAQVEAASIRYNVDQWNFFRAADGAVPVDPAAMDLMVTAGEDRNQLLSVTEYRARLTRIGLGRLTQRPIWNGPRANMWET